MLALFRKCRFERGSTLLLLGLGIALSTPVELGLRPYPGLLAASPQLREPAAAPEESEQARQLARRQKKELLKDNFEKMKRDAEELVALAKALQDELAKSNENVLSLQVMDKADKIERLAKGIKNRARGF
jgi:hypothetical protein